MRAGGWASAWVHSFHTIGRDATLGCLFCSTFCADAGALNCVTCVTARTPLGGRCLFCCLKFYGACRETVTLPTHVTSYFDEDGYLAHHIFRKDVLGLLHKFEEEIEKPHLDSKKSL